MQLRSKLFAPILAGGVLLISCINYLLLPQVISHERSEHIEHLNQQLETLANVLIDHVYGGDIIGASLLLERVYFNHPNWRQIELRASNGVTLYSSKQRQEIVTTVNMLEYEYPVHDDDNELGRLYVKYDLTPDLDQVTEVVTELQWLVLAGGILLLASLGVVIELFLIRPIARLREATTSLAKGNYDIHMPASSNDEVGRLVCDFDTMRRDILQNQQDLQLENEDRREAERQIEHNYRRQAVISAILKFSLLRLPLEEILQHTLNMLLALPKLSIDSRGAIFLTNDLGMLVMRAQSRMDASLLTQCQQVRFGHCLCGQVAASGKALITPHVNVLHEISYAGMVDHGHVIVPIQADNKTLGVINLYLAAGQTITDNEVQFIEDIAATLAGVVQRQQAEAELSRINSELEQRVQQRTREVQQQKFALDQHSIVAITDRAGTITYVNDKFCEISQYDRQELIGQNHRLLNSGVHPREFFQSMWRTIANGAVWHAEICNRRKDGSLYWVDSTIVPFPDEQGRPYQYVAIRTDITHRKQQELEILQARDAAMIADQAKGEFLAVMSHEIRTPLNGVIGVLDLMHDWPLTPDQRVCVDAAGSSAHSLLSMLNEILDFSKIESGRVELEQIMYSPTMLLTDVGELYSGKAVDKGVELQIQVSTAIPELIRGDPTRVRQILCNLTDNALKFTDTGSVTLKLELLSGYASPAWLRLEVTDTGIGISAAAQTRIFDAFTQADSSTTRRFGGTGLGLAIVSKLVALMQGRIGIDSEPGRGTTFWVELPFAQPALQSRVS